MKSNFRKWSNKYFQKVTCQASAFSLFKLAGVSYYSQEAAHLSEPSLSDYYNI